MKKVRWYHRLAGFFVPFSIVLSGDKNGEMKVIWYSRRKRASSIIFEGQETDVAGFIKHINRTIR